MVHAAKKTPKDEIRELLDQLPDDATYEDIQYHLYVHQKILQGRTAAAEGRTLTETEAKKRLARWLEP